MKKLIILIFIFCSSLSAVEWTSYGFSLQNSQKDSAEVTTDTVQDKNHNEVIVTYAGELTENYVRSIEKFNNDFRSWNSLKVKLIKFSISNDEIQIFVTPESYSYNDVNLMNYLSTGVLFTYRGNLIYNIRILVDKLFVPVKGLFVDEKSFNDKILSAIKDPIMYINARDPEYLLEKLDKLTVDLERLRNATIANANGSKLVEKEVVDVVLDIKSKNPSMKYMEIYQKIVKEKLVKSTNPNIVKTILNVYYNEF